MPCWPATAGSAFAWLQSLDDPALALPVTNPHRFFAGYAVELTDEDARAARASTSCARRRLCDRAGRGRRSRSSRPTRRRRSSCAGRGYQIINQAPGCELRAPLFAGVEVERADPLPMLRITRRAGERIRLGDDVIVEVVEVRGGTVRLGIDAPRSVPVYREELWLEVIAREPGRRRGGRRAAARRHRPAPARLGSALRVSGVPRGLGASRNPWLDRPLADHATSVNSCSSAASCSRSFLVIWPWIWHTRLSVTPRISPISRSVRL